MLLTVYFLFQRNQMHLGKLESLPRSPPIGGEPASESSGAFTAWKTTKNEFLSKDTQPGF